MEALEAEVDRLAAETDFSGVVRVDRWRPRRTGQGVRAGPPWPADPQHRRHPVRHRERGEGHDCAHRRQPHRRGFAGAVDAGSRVLGTDLPLIDDEVTVEHLLAHRSGIGDYLDEDIEHDRADYLMTVPVQELATTEQYLAVLDGFPTKFPPGEQFSYCNGGFVVLALIAERASGVPFHDLVTERVCEPAGMIDTAFLRSDELPGRAAIGYLDIDGVWRINVFHLPVRGSGDGGIYTTVADIRAAVDGHLRRSSRTRGVGRRDGATPQRHLRSGAVRARVLARRFGRCGAAGGLRRRRVVPQLAPSDGTISPTP